MKILALDEPLICAFVRRECEEFTGFRHKTHSDQDLVVQGVLATIKSIVESYGRDFWELKIESLGNTGVVVRSLQLEGMGTKDVLSLILSPIHYSQPIGHQIQPR